MTYLLITTGMLLGQALFAKTFAFGGTDDDEAFSITQTTDGGLAVAGWTVSTSVSNNELLVLRLNSDGTLAWAKAFGGSVPSNRYNRANSIIQTTDGGFAIAGTRGGFSASSWDLLVLKLNPDGSLAWVRTFGGTDMDMAWSIIQTTDGGFAVAGATRSFGAGNDDFLVLKLNPDGSLAWARTFGGTGIEWARSVIQTTDGGLAVTGNTGSFGAGADDFLVLKLNPDGSLAWARTFGLVGEGDRWEVPYSITQTTDGGFAVAGWTAWTDGEGFTYYDLLALKLNPDGSLVWARTFEGPTQDYAYSIIQTTDGGLAVAGETGVSSYDLLVSKINPDGSLAWARTFGGTDYQGACSITQTTDGGLALAGYTENFGGNRDLLVLKIDSDGNYAGCVQDCSPTVGIPSMSTSTPSVGAPCSPSSSSPSPTITTPALTITDACMPIAVEESYPSRPGSGITCSPVPGGALFVSSGDMGIRIYAADGRLAYSGKLEKGQNRITLETGVYLWIVGAGPRACPPYKGKVVVR